MRPCDAGRRRISCCTANDPLRDQVGHPDCRPATRICSSSTCRPRAVEAGELPELCERARRRRADFASAARATATPIVLLDNEAAVLAVAPDFAALRKLPYLVVGDRARRRPGHRQPRLRRLPRHRRGPGHRLGAHGAGALLGRSASAATDFTALQASKRTGILHCRAARRPRHPRRPLRDGHRGQFPALSERTAPAPDRPRRRDPAVVQRRGRRRRSSRFRRRWPPTSAPSRRWLFPLVALASLLIIIPFSWTRRRLPRERRAGGLWRGVRPLRRLRARLDLLHRPDGRLRRQRQCAHRLSRALVRRRRRRAWRARRHPGRSCAGLFAAVNIAGVRASLGAARRADRAEGGAAAHRRDWPRSR